LPGIVVRIVQVSDTHHSPRTPEARSNWDAIVDYLIANPPDLVVNTGDVSLDGANDDARARLRAVIDASSIRVVATGHVHQSRRTDVARIA
jgi:alkaline phosphatase D